MGTGYAKVQRTPELMRFGYIVKLKKSGSFVEYSGFRQGKPFCLKTDVGSYDAVEKGCEFPSIKSLRGDITYTSLDGAYIEFSFSLLSLYMACLDKPKFINSISALSSFEGLDGVVKLCLITCAGIHGLVCLDQMFVSISVGMLLALP